MIQLTQDRAAAARRDTYELDCVTEQTRENVARYASAPAEAVQQRLQELSHEWSLNRAITGVCTVGTLGGIILAAVLGTDWLALPAAFTGVLLVQTFADWSPLEPLLKRMGFRRMCAIAHERYALKALRGDFQRLGGHVSHEERVELARFEDEGGAIVAADPAPAASDADVVNEALRAART